jgi:hypothetical protein
MYVALTIEQIDRIIEGLRKSQMNQKDKYLISYLETIRKSWNQSEEVDLDEIPF